MSPIRERRLKVGATQAEIAALAEVTQATISHAENGKTISGPVRRVIELALSDLEAQNENGDDPDRSRRLSQNQTTTRRVASAGTNPEEQNESARP
jgi:DNA-binding XRE family transcriptional regulator